jgi:DNA-binding NarL/FixJ family response regulator
MMPSGQPKKVRILVADDHDVVRRGLRALFQTKPQFEICGEATTGPAVIAKAKELRPDIVLLDVNMPDMVARDAIRHIARSVPGTEILVLTMDESPKTLREILYAGARGYVFKSDLDTDLLAAVESLSGHRQFFTSRVAEAIYVDYIASQTVPPAGSTSARPGSAESATPVSLTERQREIVELLAAGKTSKEVAMALGISVKTAETHRTNIMRRLNIHSVGELVRYAVREGIVEP